MATHRHTSLASIVTDPSTGCAGHGPNLSGHGDHAEAAEHLHSIGRLPARSRTGNQRSRDLCRVRHLLSLSLSHLHRANLVVSLPRCVCQMEKSNISIPPPSWRSSLDATTRSVRHLATLPGTSTTARSTRHPVSPSGLHSTTLESSRTSGSLVTRRRPTALDVLDHSRHENEQHHRVESAVLVESCADLLALRSGVQLRRGDERQRPRLSHQSATPQWFLFDHSPQRHHKHVIHRLLHQLAGRARHRRLCALQYDSCTRAETPQAHPCICLSMFRIHI